ncbi:MAG: hypothetical protein CMJ78_08595 [Planctomycetaceae bacterium]|nr:hypothetical protein [Planctomycetaceae bacterium]
MSDRPIESLPLRDLFNDAEKLTRELIDHYEHGLIPKADQLNRTALNDEVDDTGSLRHSASLLLESYEFARQLSKKLDKYYVAIDQSVAKITGET